MNSAGVAGAWSAVRSFTPQAAPPPGRRCRRWTPNPVDGRRRERLERNGGPERGRARGRRAHHAVEQQSRGRHACRSGHGARRTASRRRLRHRDLAGRGQHDGHHHRRLQRHDENRDAHGDALDARAAAGEPAERDADSGQRRRRFEFAGHRHAVGRRTASWRRSCRSRAAIRALPACPASVTVLAGATSATFTASTAAVSASTPVTISATYNGTTRTASLTVTPPRRRLRRKQRR